MKVDTYWHQPSQVLMDVGLTALEPAQNFDSWAMLKRERAGRPLIYESALHSAGIGEGERHLFLRTQQTLLSMLDKMDNETDRRPRSRESDAIHELFDLAGLNPTDRRTGIDVMRMAEHDLFWPLALHQILRSEKLLPSEHRHAIWKFLVFEADAVRSVQELAEHNSWLMLSEIQLVPIWLREIEMRILYFKRSDAAVLWRSQGKFQYPGTEWPGVGRGDHVRFARFEKYGVELDLPGREDAVIGFGDWQTQDPSWARSAVTPSKLSEIAMALLQLRSLLPIPLDPWQWDGPAEQERPARPPRAMPPAVSKMIEAGAEEDIAGILRTPAGQLSAQQIAAAQRHFGLPESPPPRYHPAYPPRLPKYIALYRKEHPDVPMRLGWQHRLGELRRDAERAGVYEGLHYNPRAPRVGGLRVRGARPGITRELKQRLQPMLDEITQLRPAVLAAYEKAEVSRRKSDYDRAVELDSRLDVLEADVDHALEQLGSEADPLETGLKNVFGDIVAEGDEPMGFLEPPEMELADVYHDWLRARSGERSQRFGQDQSEEELAHIVRHVLFPHGELRQDVTDAELIEAARDAYEAQKALRERLQR